jgi:hypothetical protein
LLSEQKKRHCIYPSVSQFKARVNGNDTKRHVFVRAHAETSRFHALHELVLTREFTNRLDEVSAVRTSERPQTKGCQGGSNGKIDLCKRQSDDAKFLACSSNKNALVRGAVLRNHLSHGGDDGERVCVVKLPNQRIVNVREFEAHEAAT